MGNIRFLDNVAINAFNTGGGGNSSANGATIPRVILAGQTFGVSPNTSVATYKLTVVGTLIVEEGPLVELTDGTTIRANGTLYVEDSISNQGTIHNSGVIVVGGERL